MHKTPDDIKKGLGTCSRNAPCSECPYKGRGCIDKMLPDAFELVQQLEAKAGLVDQYRWERDVAIDRLEQLGIGFGEKVESKVPKWISVEERLPEKHGFYLVVTKDCVTIMEWTIGNPRNMEQPSFVSEVLGR